MYNKKYNDNTPEKREAKEKREVVQSFFMLLQIGLAMMLPIAACAFFGWLLGSLLDVDYIIIIGILFGAAVGYRNVYDMLKKYLKNPKRPEGTANPTEEELRRLEAEREFEIWKSEKDEERS
jgi:F0F1-type ATP synthase assembly protein I